MDRSGQGSTLNIGLTKSPYNPRPRQSLASSRRSLILPGCKQKSSTSRYSVSGRSNQSVQILTKTQYNTVENYGQPLPVIVTEALTFAEHCHSFSVEISAIGWAWVVCGRRLLIWQWQDPQGSNNRSNRNRVFGQQCRELTLPQSDLSHTADLVKVFVAEGNQVPSCIAVSPEGLVRYWPSIAHEGTSVEESVDLQGQECDSLIEIHPLGFILATTTCSLVLIQLSSVGHHGIVCRLLKTPSGWLGGFGRKMSSLIFGGLQSSQGNESKLINTLAVKDHGDSWSLWVLASHGLQRWTISADGTEKLIYECDIGRMVRDSYCERVFENSGDPNDLDMWLLYVQPYKKGVTILTAAVNMHSSPRLHYAFVNLSGDCHQIPTQLDFFCPIKYSVFYNEDTESEILGIEFVLNGNQAYMYSSKAVISVSAAHPNEEYDTIEFLSPGESLLGGTVLDHNVLFFTINHGLVVIVPNDFQPGDFGNSSVVSESSMLDNTALNTSVFRNTSDNLSMQATAVGNLSLYDMDPHDMMDSNKDCMSQLKAAFLLHLKRDVVACDDILRELFPNELTEVDSTLDRMVIGISKDLLEDPPAADPRWNDTHHAGLGSSTSMQIIQQLQDKLKAFHLFIDFLKTTQLWSKFGLVTQRGNVTATSYVLGECAEKIIAAIEMRKIQNNHKQLMDNAIKVALESAKARSGLTPQDLFYVQVMKVHLLIQALTKSVEDLVHSDANQLQVIDVISETNTVILTILQAVVKYRQDYATTYSPAQECRCEYLPWTTAMGKHGLRDSLTTLHAITLRHAARCSDGHLRSSLYDNLVNLADLVLDGRQAHLESTKGTEKYSLLLQQYESQRAELIYPLVEDQQYERATSLAEKYLDFQILIQICEQTQNQARLDEYMEKFKEHDFSNYLFNWYIREKKGGALLNRFKTKQSALNSFLGQHPTLSWIQQALNGQYEQSCQTLQELATQETELLCRKKTILSLAKMAAVCASDDMTQEVDGLSDELQLIQFQQELPDSVLVAYGYDVQNMRVLPAHEIIQLYICEENVTSNEMHFKMALDLLKYIKDPLERAELSHTIWIAAVRRDPWQHESSDNALSVVSATLYFKLIDCCFLMGEDLDEVMPPIEQILGAPELGSFGEDKSFQYLLKVGYEHFLQTHKPSK